MNTTQTQLEELYRINLQTMAMLRVLDPNMPTRIQKNYSEVLNGEWELVESPEEFAVPEPMLKLVISR